MRPSADLRLSQCEAFTKTNYGCSVNVRLGVWAYHCSIFWEQERVSCFLCQANRANAGNLACPFLFGLAKISGRHTSLDRISCDASVVCGSLMWRAASTSRESVKRESSQCQVRNAKGTS